ncbi:uncharacterized protein V1518DRAFT_418507 [Limtongia smithiae]|uniref:uncharacterized protein n=1 Tax=Limtongia smithiae TaxID=1125753 RepID=UPI0034CE3C56
MAIWSSGALLCYVFLLLAAVSVARRRGNSSSGHFQSRCPSPGPLPSAVPRIIRPPALCLFSCTRHRSLHHSPLLSPAAMIFHKHRRKHRSGPADSSRSEHAHDTTAGPRTFLRAAAAHLANRSASLEPTPMASVDRRPLFSGRTSFGSAALASDMAAPFSSPLACRARPVSDIVLPSPAAATPIPPRRQPFTTHSSMLSTPGDIEFDSWRRYIDDAAADPDTDLFDHPEQMSVLADQWLAELDNYDGSLEALTSSSTSSASSAVSSASSSSATPGGSAAAFKSELSAIETWFSRVLTDAERTATLYTLLQNATPVQSRFFINMLMHKERKRIDSSAAPRASQDSENRLRGCLRGVSLRQEMSERASSLGLTCDDLEEAFVADADESILESLRRRSQATSSAPSTDGTRAISPIGSEKSCGRSLEAEHPTPQSGLYAQQKQASFSSPVTSSWASMMNTPAAVPAASSPFGVGFGSADAQTTIANAEIVANATAMKLAALSTVNNRILVDTDIHKLRRRNLLERSAASSPSFASPLGGMMYSNENAQFSPMPPPRDFGSGLRQSSPMEAAVGSSPFSSAAIRSRRAAFQQKFEASGSAVAAPLFSSPSVAGRHGTFSPVTPAVKSTSQSALASSPFDMQFGGILPGAVSPAVSSPLTDWYSASGSTPAANLMIFAADVQNLASGSESSAQFGNNNAASSQEQQRSRESASPAQSTTSVSSSKSTSTTSTTASSTASETQKRATAAAATASGEQSPQRDAAAGVPEEALLNDISAWLRSLRLHKYTSNLKNITWQELVSLSEAELTERGVTAMGARRKMLKVFETVREAKAKEIEEYFRDVNAAAGSEA